MLKNPKHEAFARACADGAKGAAAFRKHVSDKGAAKSQHERASKLLASDKVKSRVAELRVESDKIATEKRLMSKEEALLFLTEIARTPVGKVDENSRLAQEVTYGQNDTKIKMPGKIDAIKQAAAMCGWNEPEVVVTTPMSWDSILELATKSAVFRKTVVPMLRELLGKIEGLPA
jgi:hypothetical protein